MGHQGCCFRYRHQFRGAEGNSAFCATEKDRVGQFDSCYGSFRPIFHGKARNRLEYRPCLRFSGDWVDKLSRVLYSYCRHSNSTAYSPLFLVYRVNPVMLAMEKVALNGHSQHQHNFIEVLCDSSNLAENTKKSRRLR